MMKRWAFGFCPQVAGVLFALLPLRLPSGVSEGDPVILSRVLMSSGIHSVYDKPTQLLLFYCLLLYFSLLHF